MMAQWLALCDRKLRGRFLQTLRAYDRDSRIEFAVVPQDLRQRLRDAPRGSYGVAIGPYSGSVPWMNLCAALAKDQRAAEIDLILEAPDESSRQQAYQLGCTAVLAFTRTVDATGPVERAPRDATIGSYSGMVSRELSSAVPEVDVQAAVVAAAAGQTVPAPILHAAPAPAAHRTLDAAPASAAHRTPDAAPTSPPPPETSAKAAPILVLTSGRGGVGKTVLAALMGAQAAAWGMKVSLCDFDLSCGNLYSCFGLPHGLELDKYYRTESRAGGLTGAGSVACPEGLDVCAAKGLPESGDASAKGKLLLFGPCGRPEEAEIIYPFVPTLLDHLRHSSDLVVVDTSTTFTDAVAEAVQKSDRLLIVSDEPEPVSAAASRCAALAVRLGLARTRIVRVQNRLDAKARNRTFANEQEAGLEASRVFSVCDGGGEFAELMRMGEATLLPDASSEAAQSCRSMLAVLLEELGQLPQVDAAKAAAREAQRRASGKGGALGFLFRREAL